MMLIAVATMVMMITTTTVAYAYHGVPGRHSPPQPDTPAQDNPNNANLSNLYDSK